MDKSKQIEIGKWFAIVSVLSALLGITFYSVWSDGAWRYIHQPIEQFVGIDPVVGTEFIMTWMLGLFLTFVVVMYNDKYKRVQTTLLGAGMVVLVGVLIFLGIGEFLLEPTAHTAVGFGVGVGLALLLVSRSGDLYNIDWENSSFGDIIDKGGGDIRFKNTTRIFKYSIFTVVIIANGLGLYMDSLSNFANIEFSIFAVIVSIGFIYAMNELISIDISQETASQKSFELIGPKQSGKTYSTLALFLTADDGGQFKLVDNSPSIDKLLDDIPAIHFHDPEAIDDEEVGFDAISGTDLDEYPTYSFDFIHKTGMTDVAKVSTMDYKGELLPDVAKKVENKATDGGYEDDSFNDQNNIEATNNASDDADENATRTDGGSGEEETENVDGHNVDIGSTENNGSEPSSQSKEDSDTSISSKVVDEVTQERTGKSENGTKLADENIIYSSETVEEKRYDDLIDMTEETRNTLDEVPDSINESGRSNVESDVENTSSEVDESPEQTVSGSETQQDSDETPEQKGGFEESAEQEEDEEVEKDSREEVLNVISENVKDSDKLAMILDVERFLGEMSDIEGNMQTFSMKQIARNTSNEEVILVATKSDFFIEEWRETEGYQGDPVTEDQKRWKNFREFVSEQFRDTPSTSALMQTVNATKVYPVYYHTDDNYDLTTDENGNIKTEGYDKLLEALAN